MNSKMTKNSWLSSAEPKTKTKQRKQATTTEQNHRNGDHMEDYQWGGGGGRMGGKGTGNKKHNW